VSDPRPATTAPGDQGGRRQRPSDESMSLLNNLLAHTLDEDYAPATARRRSRQQEHDPAGMVGLMSVLAVFGLLIVTMVLQTNRAAPAVEEERGQLIARINDEGEEVEALRQRADDLQASVARLEDDVLSRSRAGQALQSQQERLGILSGAVPVTGPGIVITVDDAEDAVNQEEGQVLDTDLQKLVNALWVAGAEAVAIDNQRISSRTAIRGAGSAITVNYRSLTRPYVVRAIGDPDTLPARLLETEGGRAWLDLQVNFGVEFSTETRESITVPAGVPPPTRFARVAGGSS
jgi:uncharacterized protein YlxW (UPF0749 family)